MSALADHLWQSTLFGLAVWLVTLMLAANRAAVRHALWFAASLKFLVPFSLLVLAGEWIGMTPAYETAAAASPVDRALEAAAPLVAPAAVHAPAAAGPMSWQAALALAWVAGALVVAARWRAAWRAAESAVRRATPVAVGDGLDVRASPDAGEPAVARILRPVILVPAGLVDALSRAELGVVLAHERAHILRRDNLQTGVHMLVETLFWFHPLVWWIGRRMIDERECACDEAVVDAGHTGRDYAAGILAVCRHCSGQHRLAGAISALSGNLPRRIRRIIGAAPPAALGFVKAMTLSVLAVAAFAVPVAAGAAKDERARRAAFLHDARVLGTADLRMSRAAGGPRRQVVVGARALRVENVSMPELIGLAYGVDPARIAGAEGLGVQRYDLRAEASGAFADPRRFDPAALRVVVSRLLGAHFNLELHVNKRCQAPCGAQAFTIRLR